MKNINIILIIMIFLLSNSNESYGQTWQSENFQRIDTMITYNCDIILVIDDGSLGRELYKCNGDTILLIADVNPGLGSGVSHPYNLINYNNELVFVGNDGVHGNELFKYDGSTVTMIADFFSGVNAGVSFFFDFVIHNNELYFLGSNGVNGSELYKYDGNSISNVSGGVNVSHGIKPTTYNNELYFCGKNSTSGHELFKYDGVTTSLVVDLFPGNSDGFLSENNQVTVFNNELVFVGNDGVNGGGLYKYDGTSVSFITSLIPNVVGDWDHFIATVYNNEFYFMYNGIELYKYDGNTVSLIIDINPGTSISYPRYSNLSIFNNELLFIGNDPVFGNEMFKYDGNTVSLVMDLNPGSSNSMHLFLIQGVYNNALHFLGDNGVTGRELYKYDGSTISLVAEFIPGVNGLSYSSRYSIVHNCELYLRGSSKLYKFNSTLDMTNCSCSDQPCSDYITTNTPDGIYLGVGDTTFNFDSTLNQQIAMEIYGVFNSWDLSNNHQADQTYFQVNGTTSVSLETIYNNLPYTLNGVVITIDTNDLNLTNSMAQNMTSGTIIFTGNVDNITMVQFESGITKLCVEGVVSPPEQSCTDYVTPNNPDGLYGSFVSESFNFDSTLNQQIAMEIYGLFNNWDLSNSHQADQTYFKVNGNDSVSLETIYNNLPYTLNGVVITIDTNDLNLTNSMAQNMTSGTIIFTGNVDNITMVQFESGIIQICKELNPDCGCEHGPCPCNIAAEFTYTNSGHNYNFLSAATGSEYEWSFGDGENSSISSPYHLYSTPGVYEVCLTNYNLTDSCTITICDSIVVACVTPNANIITPNQDGIDDYVLLNCGDVNVYNRNGALIVTLTNQTIWDGRDANQNLVPMGEYVLLCTTSGVAMNVTVIR